MPSLSYIGRPVRYLFWLGVVVVERAFCIEHYNPYLKARTIARYKARGL